MSYVSLDDLSNTVFSDPFSLHLNVRSLPRHLDDIKAFISGLKSDLNFLALSETWTKKAHESFLSIEGFNAEFYHRNDAYGGVALYVKSDVSYSVRRDLCIKAPMVESLFVETATCPTALCCYSRRPLIFGVVYRSPSSDFNLFLSAFEDLLHMLSFSKYNCIIVGDFNVDLLKKDYCLPLMLK